MSRLTARKALKDGWRTWLVVAGLALGALGAFVGSLLWFPWPRPYVGEYVHLYRVRAGSREVLAVQTRDSGGKDGSRHTYLLCFDPRSGKSLGRIHLPTSGPRDARVALGGARGTRAYFSSSEGYWIVDLATASVVARQRDRARSFGPHKTLSFDERRWGVSIVQQNGQEALVSLGARPTIEAVLDRVDPGGGQCGTWARHRREGRRVSGLLRAVPIHTPSLAACSFPSGTDTVQLYLHRDTAFGAGHYLISAVTKAGKRKWTVDLSERCDSAAAYEILLAEAAGKALRVLVGASDTIYWFLLDPESGHVLRARSLY